MIETQEADPNEQHVLAGARRWIQYGWTQGAKARDRRGQAGSALDIYQTSFCLVGAIERSVYGSRLERLASTVEMRRENSHLMQAVLRRLSRLIFLLNTGPALPRFNADYDNVMRWNDMPGRSQYDVLQLLDRAIDAK